ncbi:hypothetical protein [Ketogulonicigenium vulgare]|uniref:hypothetical protein n=1 Tax=Ketogulonicigenium vulgare TaxID=92945 RepID=UPI0005C6CF72|nr:hypothetical protein [Ketogulonicigenium vulgare]ALJ80741.1 hypothetical protein KVH_05810 [Ketogulonicigenium vulgare]ANW33539.1 hypothetical protein KvSKV_05780 [Ketogulonicigenium vulgare]
MNDIVVATQKSDAKAIFASVAELSDAASLKHAALSRCETVRAEVVTWLSAFRGSWCHDNAARRCRCQRVDICVHDLDMTLDVQKRLLSALKIILAKFGVVAKQLICLAKQSCGFLDAIDGSQDFISLGVGFRSEKRRYFFRSRSHLIGSFYAFVRQFSETVIFLSVLGHWLLASRLYRAISTETGVTAMRSITLRALA